MIKFTYRGKTLAYMPRVGAIIDQVKACRMLVADLNSLDTLDIIVKSKN